MIDWITGLESLQGSSHITGVSIEDAHPIEPADDNGFDLGVIEGFGDPGTLAIGRLEPPPPNMPTWVLPCDLALWISGHHPHGQRVGHPGSTHPDIECVTLGQIFGSGHLGRKAPATV